MKKARRVGGRKTNEELWGGRSATAVGGVTVGRNQQGHMVVILFSADAKAQNHHVEEGRLWQLHATGTVIVAGAELQLVHTAAVVVALEQRRVAAAVAVGHGAGDQLQLRAVDAVQLNLDGAAGTAVSGVQNVCGQTSHGVYAPPEVSRSECRTFSGQRKSRRWRIKTFFKKVVHNKNHKPYDPPADPARPPDSWVILAFKRPFIN